MKLKGWIATWAPWSLGLLLCITLAFAVLGYNVTIGNGVGAPGSSGNAVTISAGSLPADLSGFQVYIKYNKNVLTPDTASLAISPGFAALVNATWTKGVSVTPIDGTYSYLNIQLYDGSLAGSNASASSVNLCTINFSVAAGATTLNNPLEVLTSSPASPGFVDTSGAPVATSWVNGNFQVTGIPTGAGTISMTAVPVSITADNVSTTQITSAAIKDAAGANVPNGTKITVATDLGAITTADADLVTDGIQVLTTNGIITFTLQANLTVATATVTATSVTGDATGTKTVPFTAIPATKLIVTGIADPIVAGETSTIQVKAANAAGQTATGYVGTVHFTSSDPQVAGLPADYTFLSGDSGIKTFPGVILKTKGTQSVTATDTVTATITGTQSVTVNPATANKINLTANPMVISSSLVSESTLTAQIVDAYNNLITAATDNVTFAVTSSTFGNIKSGFTTVAAVGGVATSYVQSVIDATGGTIPCTADATGLTQGTVTVTTAPKVLQSIAIAITTGGKVSTATPKVGETVQFTATGTFRDTAPPNAITQDIITTQVAWSVSNAKGTIGVNTGLFFAAQEGAVNVSATLASITSNVVAMANQPANPVVINTATPTTIASGGTINFATASSGGTGDGFNYSLDAAGLAAGGTIDASGLFTAGPTAGVYTVKVEDKTSLAFTTYSVKEPFTITPTSWNFKTTDAAKTFTIAGVPATSTGYTWDIMDSATATAPVTTPADYGTWSNGSTVADPATKTNDLAPNAAQTLLKKFYVRVTVADAGLVAAGLDKVTVGPFNIIPISAYTVTVTTITGTKLSGAQVSVEYPKGTIIGPFPTDVDGVATFNLPETGGSYEYTIAMATYVTQTKVSNLKAVPVTLLGIGGTISGTVTDTAPAPAALPGMTVYAYQPTDLATQFQATTIAGGAFTIDIPTGKPTTGWTVTAVDPASPRVYASATLPNKSVGNTDANFALAAAVGDADVGGGTINTTVTYLVSVVVPAGGFDMPANITITENATSAATPGSPKVYEVTATAVAAGTLGIQRLEITIPIDLSVVLPGTLESGAYVIYHAANAADLAAGKGIPVPKENILPPTDYLGTGPGGTPGVIGSVTFWVNSLSAFGIGAASGGGGVSLTDTSSSGRCFIATAAFGSPFEKHVEILRAFRDAYLLPSKLGRLFVETYYTLSPKAAAVIAESEILRAVVRVALLPIVGLSYLMLQFGAGWCLLALAAMLGSVIWAVAVIRRRRSQTA